MGRVAELGSLDVTSVPLFIAPVVSFGISVWVALCLLFGWAGQELKGTSLAFLALVAAAICAYTARRLYPRRLVPDFRAAFLLNAAGLAAFLSWFGLLSLSGMWQYLIHWATK